MRRWIIRLFLAHIEIIMCVFLLLPRFGWRGLVRFSPVALFLYGCRFRVRCYMCCCSSRVGCCVFPPHCVHCHVRVSCAYLSVPFSFPPYSSGCLCRPYIWFLFPGHDAFVSFSSSPPVLGFSWDGVVFCVSAHIYFRCSLRCTGALKVRSQSLRLFPKVSPVSEF